MNYDYYVYLAGLSEADKEKTPPPWRLSGGVIDKLTTHFLRNDLELKQIKDDRQKRREIETNKSNIRDEYKQNSALRIPVWLLPFARIDFSSAPSSGWIGLQVDFELVTFWYSRDDRVFHLLDNPVRKDQVFGVPFMAASSWKGMLRWACRMQAGLRAHLESGKPFREWEDPAWILHLFGNVKGEEEEFHRGALVFYPTWFDRIGFAVINPHSRERRAGTQPIYYEVVPPGAEGTLHLLYAPWPGMQPAADPKEFMPHLLQAIETLLTEYGISAKRTVGWGTAKITRWKAFRRDATPVEADSRDELCEQIQNWLRGGNVT